MNNLKTVLAIVGGSVLIVLLMIIGLSKMAVGGETETNVDEAILLDGAKLVTPQATQAGGQATQSGEVKVTVVNFSCMQCPACKSAHSYLNVLENMPGVRYVIRHFPLSSHAYSVHGAKAVEAARQLGKGWEMLNLLFEKQGEWSAFSRGEIDQKMNGYATGLGMSGDDFKKTYESNETAKVVFTDRALAEKLKLSGTPTIYVNGEQTAPQFVLAKVEELLKK